MPEKGMTPELFQQLYSQSVQNRFFKAVYDAVLRSRKEEKEKEDEDDE